MKQAAINPKVDSYQPFHAQDLNYFSNSQSCLPYNSYDVSLENLTLDQLLIFPLVNIF